MKKIILVTLLCCSLSLFSQLKVGSNATTISSLNNIEIEASNSKKVFVNKADGRTYVENKPTALITDSIMMTATDGEIRQMSIARLMDALDFDGDGIPNGTDPDDDGDGVLDSLDLCPLQYGCDGSPKGCPSACNYVVKTDSSSNGSAVITAFNNCSAGSTGTLTQLIAVSGVTQTIQVTVATAGSYNLSASANGVVFSGSGTLSVGVQNIVLTASGTPNVSGINTFTINTKPTCSFTRNVISNVAISSLDCANAVQNGTLTSGVAASSVSSVISYTGGNGTAYSGQSISSTGVTGLTATLTSGNFASGSGTLTFVITGTPATNGTASFAINVGGQSCTLTRTVSAPITIPSTITLAQNRYYMVASVYDQDYLPYTAPTTAATTSVQAANGVNEAVTINYQGTITTTGVSVQIPVTASGSGTLPAYSTTVVVPANLTEDGISRTLSLSWAAQSYTASTKSISATIASVGGTLNAKKLDVNSGIGNDVMGVLLGAFTFPYNNAGTMTTYQVRDIAGIPDKKFGVADNSGSTTNHMMLYLPTLAEDGKIWLNNNLGANYSNINHSSFNLAQQATSSTDYQAYGSLFQWGRKSDGHELIIHNNGLPIGTSGVNGTTSTRDNNPTHSLFITCDGGVYADRNWGTSVDNSLWSLETSPNNPCPVGFRLPTDAELTTLFNAAGITNAATAAASFLKFTLTGARFNSFGEINNQGSNGAYWTNTSYSLNTIMSNYMAIDANAKSMSATYKAIALAIRCIKD